jgi:hypothetical protein
MRCKSLITFGGFAVAATLTATSAFAASAFHPEPTEAGAQFHPQHVTQKSRAEVQTALRQAQQHPAWQSTSRGAPWPVAADSPKTREQVRAELVSAMQHPAWNAVSRGAPWAVENPGTRAAVPR